MENNTKTILNETVNSIQQPTSTSSNHVEFSYFNNYVQDRKEENLVPFEPMDFEYISTKNQDTEKINFIDKTELPPEVSILNNGKEESSQRNKDIEERQLVIYQIFQEIRIIKDDCIKILDDGSQKILMMDLVMNLVSKLAPCFESQVHENIVEAFKDIIVSTKSVHILFFETMNNLLESLFGFIIQGSVKVYTSFKHLSTVTNSIYILNLLLFGVFPRKDGWGKVVTDVYRDFVSTTLSQLHFLNTILISPTEREISMTYGNIKPFGQHRIAILEFLETLVKIRSVEVFREFVKLKIFQNCMNLFVQYPWNNFLHKIVSGIIITVLIEDNVEKKIFLLETVQLTERIIDMVKRDKEARSKQKGIRLGYMGWITKISNQIMEEKNPMIIQRLKKNNAWNQYVSTDLAITNGMERKQVSNTQSFSSSIEKWLQSHTKY